MQKARKGQWLILSGIILAVGLVSLTTLLNEALSAGYRVALSETEFPAHEINEIYEETVRTAKLVWGKNKIILIKVWNISAKMYQKFTHFTAFM